MSSSESQGLAVVLDAAALIAGTDSLFSLGGLVNTETGDSLYSPSSEAKVTFFSVPEVFHEIRDPRARARLALLQGSIVLRAPSSETMAETIDFAKRTGDFAALSLTDLKVIALTRMLEREANGDAFLKTAPVQRLASDVRIGKTIPFEVLDQLEAEEAQKRLAGNETNWDDDGEDAEGEWQTVSKPRRKRTSEKPKPMRKGAQSKDTYFRGTKKPFLEQETSNSEDATVEVKEAKTKMRMLANDDMKVKVEMNSKKEMTRKTETSGADGTKEVKKKMMEEENQDLSGSTCGEPKRPDFGDEKNVQQVNSARNRSRARPLRRGRKAVEAKHTIAKGENVETVEDRAGEAQFTTDGLPHNVEKNVDPVLEMNAGELSVHDCSSDETQDSDDDGSEWINESNLEEHLARDRGEELDSETERNRVACVTTDFAMQNTMLQMGLKLLSVDGRRSIRKIKHFALRCHSCGIVTTELERKFCEKCGNSSMHRVAYKIDKNGIARAFLNPKKKASLRGTKYPIPMPRGGRHNNDLILREDQIDPVKQRRLQKQRERLNVDVLDPSNFYNAGARFNPHNKPLIVGYGRRNPNEVRGSSRNKR